VFAADRRLSPLAADVSTVRACSRTMLTGFVALFGFCRTWLWT
jgi:hypothetical protein